MEQDNKKRRTGQNIAFYTALAVCLIAVGVGTWELLQPEKASDGAAAVSSAVALPDGGAASGDDGGATLWEGGGVGPEDVSGDGAEIPASGAAEIPESASASGSAESGAASGNADAAASAAKNSGTVTGAASVPAAGKSATGDAKSSAKSDGGAKSTADAKSDGGAKATTDAKSGKTEAKSKDSDAKSKSGAKADAAKPSGEATRPVEGETVTSFSMDKLLYNETMRDWRTHDGIDIAADAGTAVVAARPGTVETVEADPIMGTTVTVRHEGKWESVYASLADMAEVEAGDDVTAGQVLGFVGDTAASESALGPHLHFSVLNDGTPVDPETFLA